MGLRPAPQGKIEIRMPVPPGLPPSLEQNEPKRNSPPPGLTPQQAAGVLYRGWPAPLEPGRGSAEFVGSFVTVCLRAARVHTHLIQPDQHRIQHVP